jgi:Raf kinase inhibitor-like YbhB/YbcL family protein
MYSIIKRTLTITILALMAGCSIFSTPTTMDLTSPAFENGGNIPSKYTCDAENISPPLAWSEVPEGTVSFVLIHDDPDAIPVAGHVWDHWILFNVPTDVTSIPENSTVGTEGETSFGKTDYGGPCPPSGEHRYLFKLYALRTTLDLPKGSTKKEIEDTIAGDILAEAELVGLYHRAR